MARDRKNRRSEIASVAFRADELDLLDAILAAKNAEHGSGETRSSLLRSIFLAYANHLAKKASSTTTSI